MQAIQGTDDGTTRLMTFREVADYLSLSPRTVERMVHAGELPAVRLSPRAVRFREVDVRDLISRRLQRGGDEP